MSRVKGFLARLARPRRLMAACYIAAVALWLLAGAVALVWDRARPEVRLALTNADPVQAEPAGDGALVTTGGDAQLVFEGINTPVRRVLLEGRFAREPGEMELFYTRKAGQGFSAGRGLLAVAGADGTPRPLVTLPGRRAIGAPVEEGWLYTLPPGRVLDLRLDLGMAVDNTVEVSAVVLNPRLAAWRYFAPSPRQLAMLAAGPALGCCGILAVLAPLRARRGRAAAGRPGA